MPSAAGFQHVVRELERRDVDAWAAMRGRLWPDANSAELVQEARDFVQNGCGLLLDAVFLAEDDTARPIGFLEMSLRVTSDGCDSSPVPHVEGWFVEDAARGRGRGRALMRAAEEWSRARGYKELASDTEIHNEGSLLAHQKCGFEEVDRLIKFRKKL